MFLVLLLVLFACVGEPVGISEQQGTAKLRVTSMVVTPDTIALDVNDVGTARCQPRNRWGVLLTNTCTWVSRKPAVATVPTTASQTIPITARATGITWVVATVNALRDSVKVCVNSGTTMPCIQSATGIPIAPGDNWQTKINAQPVNTQFRVLTGTHTNATAIPKSGQQFIGDPGAIMDGTNTVSFAFTGAASNVLIRTLEIKNYTGGGQLGAINGFDAVNWTYDRLDVHNNPFMGINLRGNFTVLGGRYHDNGQYGLSCFEGNGGTVDGAELDNNNVAEAFLPLWDAGGVKVTSSTGVTFRNVNSHHNHGPGIWYDINNINSVIENNNSHDNTEAGIFYEISMAGIIRNNTATGNGTADVNHTGANILVSASRDVEVYGNTVSGHHGIIALQEDRGNNSLGQVNQVVNLYVHDNTVTVASGKRSGFLDFISTADATAMVQSRNNRFNFNAYTITGNTLPFYGGSLTAISKATWQAAPISKDLNSTFIGP